MIVAISDSSDTISPINTSAYFLRVGEIMNAKRSALNEAIAHTKWVQLTHHLYGAKLFHGANVRAAWTALWSRYRASRSSGIVPVGTCSDDLHRMYSSRWGGYKYDP